jgi:hypothetical protein
MKKFIYPIFTLSLFVNFANTDSVNGVHGNWGPQHNTRNFNYVVVKGNKDYFKHKRSNRTVGTKCKRGEGVYKIDAYSDGRDACVKQRFVCPSGYSLK